jgi:hypothetical protein
LPAKKHDYLLNKLLTPLKIRTKEKTKIAKTPTTVVKGSMLAKNVPSNGISTKAKPARIDAKNKKINRSMIFPPS